MKKAVWSAVITAAAVVVFSGTAFAQASANGTVNITATVAAKAKLTLGAGAIAFPDADPDVSPSLVAAAMNVDVKARTGAAGNVTLTVVADDDLVSGTDVITIDNLTWTVGGAGFSAGTSDKTTAQTVGSWTGSGNRAGSQTYALANSWTYATGTYAAILTYTLTVP